MQPARLCICNLSARRSPARAGEGPLNAALQMSKGVWATCLLEVFVNFGEVWGPATAKNRVHALCRLVTQTTDVHTISFD